ncbi:MAG: hypothetical protein M5U19_10320 [Microthrixaceae bacterium]|nr:hypothetical protein [Microthrixaceae bacterium]
MLSPADTCVAPVNTVTRGGLRPAHRCAGPCGGSRIRNRRAVSPSAPGWAGTLDPAGPYTVRDPTTSDVVELLAAAGVDGERLEDLMEQGVIA